MEVVGDKSGVGSGGQHIFGLCKYFISWLSIFWVHFVRFCTDSVVVVQMQLFYDEFLHKILVIFIRRTHIYC